MGDTSTGGGFPGASELPYILARQSAVDGGNSRKKSQPRCVFDSHGERGRRLRHCLLKHVGGWLRLDGEWRRNGQWLLRLRDGWLHHLRQWMLSPWRQARPRRPRLQIESLRLRQWLLRQ